MTVWDHRLLARGDFEIRDDGAPEILVSLSTRVDRPGTLILAIVDAVARHQGGTTAPQSSSPVDWRALGWSGRGEHDEHLTDLRRLKAAWSESPLCGRLDQYVHGEMERAGIPHRPPYSIDQLDALDRIVRRAPAVVEQDAAAEGIAA